MFISIIIPCYNGYKFMSKCLMHLEHQTFKSFEIVICDDCSTDDSYERLVEYSHSSKLTISLIRSEKNVGPGEARNKAINLAKGNYLMFCDCDDWYEDNALEIMARAAENNNADLVMCDNYYSDYKENKQKRNATKELIGCESKKKQLAFARMSLCRLIVKKELFDGITIPSIYNGEDGAVVPILLAKSRKSIFIDNALYNYFVRSESGSTKPLPRVYQGLLLSYDNVEKALGNDYPDECEFIGIKTVLYGAVFNALKAKVERIRIKKVINDFEIRHPDWQRNKYLASLSKTKKLFLYFAKRKAFFVLLLYSKMHTVFEKRMFS